MSLDQLALHAPSILAKGLAGKRAGEDRARQQQIEAERREQQIKQAALGQMLLEMNLDETRATGPVRRKLLEAQAADATAQAEGTGRYASRPPTPALDPRDVHRDNRLFDIEHPLPVRRGGGPGGLTDLQREQRAVAGQIDDTRSDLSRAEREGLPRMTRPSYLPKNREAGFVADSTAAARKIFGLQKRADSLTGVNDDLVSRMSGGPGAARRPSFGDVQGGGTTGQSPMEVELLRNQARSAIERGARADSVRARFKRLTGKDYF